VLDLASDIAIEPHPSSFSCGELSDLDMAVVIGDPQASLESLVRALRATGTIVNLTLSPTVRKARA